MGSRLVKKLGWDIEVGRIVQEAAKTPFKWGETDCLCFASSCIQAATGLDVMEGHQGQYKTAREAYRMILEHRDKIEGIFSEYFDEIPLARAQRGDGIIAYLKEGPTFGIVSLDGKRAALKAEEGLLFIPLTNTSVRMRAWRVK